MLKLEDLRPADDDGHGRGIYSKPTKIKSAYATVARRVASGGGGGGGAGLAARPCYGSSPMSPTAATMTIAMLMTETAYWGR